MRCLYTVALLAMALGLASCNNSGPVDFSNVARAQQNEVFSERLEGSFEAYFKFASSAPGHDLSHRCESQGLDFL
jgi:hypothetical protein